MHGHAYKLCGNYTDVGCVFGVLGIHIINIPLINL